MQYSTGLNHVFVDVGLHTQHHLNTQLTDLQHKSHVILLFFIFRDLYFEKAYCEYRQNEPHKSINTIEKAPEMSSGLLELKAQVLYKLERYEESYILYRDNVKRALDDYDNERQTNISALLSFIPLPEVCTSLLYL